MVGVKTSTSVRSGPSNASVVPSSRAFIAGVTERGSTTPKPVRSIVEFEAEFGGLQSYSAHMYRCARTFYEEGGSELVVCRAVGITPLAGKLTLKDRTAVTALDTLTIDAANPGAWSSTVTVSVTAGRVADSVTLTAWVGAERVAYVRDKTTVAAIAAALATNPYIRGTDKGAVSVGVTRLPALMVATALTAGTDDRATLLATAVVTALDGAGATYGAGAVATPGYYADTVGAGLIAHCVTNRRIAVLAGQVDDEIEDLSGTADALTTNGDYAGLFAPWVVIPEGSSAATVSPEGYILGVRARVMNAEGYWQAPAGNRAKANYVLGTSAAYSPTDVDTLADAHVSAITQFGTMTVLYGWRSLSLDSDSFALLNARDFLNTLTELVETALQPYIFETIDGTGQLVSRIKGALVGVVQPIADAGGLTARYNEDGTISNPAYRVDVSVLNETTISCTVTVRLSGTAEEIQVNIIKAAFNASV